MIDFASSSISISLLTRRHLFILTCYYKWISSILIFNLILPQARAQALAEALLEGQPSVRVSALVLRQWYARYHSDSGPLRFGTAAALEEGMGDEIRIQYAGLGYKALCKALGQRRKAVEASEQVCRTWVDQYAAAAEPPAKKGRRAIEPPEVSAAASSSGPQARIKLLGAKAVEEACGPRYRREVTDLGLGFAHRQMASTLRTWGYDASRESCQERRNYLFITYLCPT